MGRALFFLTACLSASSCTATRASTEACPVEDASALLQRHAKAKRTDGYSTLFESEKNSFLREVESIPREYDVKLWNAMQKVHSDTSIPKGEGALAMVEEAAKVFYKGDQLKDVTQGIQNFRKWTFKEGNPLGDLAKEWQEFREWWNKEPANRRSAGLTPAQWVRNYIGPGRKSQKGSCRFNKPMLANGVAEVLMAISKSMHCNTTEENAVVCTAEPFAAARSITYVLAYAQYAASYCAPTFKVTFLCGGAATETVSRLIGLMNTAMMLGGTCQKDYTPPFNFDNPKALNGFLGNCIMTAGREFVYIVISYLHFMRYFSRSAASFNLEHPVRATVFDLGSTLAWALHLPVIMVRDCAGAHGDKKVVDKLTDAKTHCWSEGAQLASYISSFSAAESRRRDYCLDSLNKRGARHNAPPAVDSLNGLYPDGTPKIDKNGQALLPKRAKGYAVGVDQEIPLPENFWGDEDDDDDEFDDVRVKTEGPAPSEQSKPIYANWNYEDPEEAVLDGTDMEGYWGDVDDESDLPNEFEDSETPDEMDLSWDNDVDWSGGIDDMMRTAPLTPPTGGNIDPQVIVGGKSEELPFGPRTVPDAEDDSDLDVMTNTPFGELATSSKFIPIDNDDDDDGELATKSKFIPIDDDDDDPSNPFPGENADLMSQPLPPLRPRKLPPIGRSKEAPTLSGERLPPIRRRQQ